MVSLIEGIKADRKEDPEADCGWKWGAVVWDEHTSDVAYVLSDRKIASPFVARRIGRVPAMEAALIAADELALYAIRMCEEGHPVSAYNLALMIRETTGAAQ